jgi:hypothetical protein
VKGFKVQRNLFLILLVVFTVDLSIANAAQVLPQLQSPEPIFKNHSERRAVPYCRRSGLSQPTTAEIVTASVIDPLQSLGTDLLRVFRQVFLEGWEPEPRDRRTAVSRGARRQMPSDTVWLAGHKRLCG